MSGESTDSESFRSDNHKRSRSLFRQVRAKFSRRSSSRNRKETNNESSSILLLHQKYQSFDDNIDSKKFSLKSSKKKNSISKTPRLSIFHQVKSHLDGNRKYHQTVSSTWSDDEENNYQSLPINISNSETKSSSTNEDNQSVFNSSSEPTTPETFLNSLYEDGGDDKAMLLDNTYNNNNANNGTDDETQRKSLPNRTGLNKFTEQLAQRAKSVITKSPASPANTSPTTVVAQTPGASSTVYWTEILIERGKDLASKDISGLSDPYVKVVYGDEEKYTTNTVEKSLNPIWNEKFTIFTDNLNTPLYFRLYDRDRISKDEGMGSAKLDLWKLPFERAYSATLDLEDENRNDGKVGMLKVTMTIIPKTSEFRDEVLRSLAKQAQTRGGRAGVIVPRRTIDVFVIEGRNFKLAGAQKVCNPYVRLKFENHKKYRTQTIKATTNPIWHQSFMYDTTANELAALELTVFDDTSSSGDFIGRGTCNLAHIEEERTHRISVDLEDGAGVIDLFITITVTTALQEATSDGDSSANVALDVIPSRLTDAQIQHYKFFSTLRSLNPIFDVGKLEIKIYQARDLSAKDVLGKSDPFCIVELDSNRLRTHTIYKTLNPVWNKSFVIPVQDIHSVMEITIYDEDTNKNTEFIGRVAIPLLAIKNGQKKWLQLKDRKCLLPVKGAIEIEATLVYTNLKAIIRTFNPRQTAYYQIDNKFSVGAIKQHIARIQNMLSGVINVFKFIDYCFHWENPFISFFAFMSSIVIVWNFELYMLPCTILLLFARNAVIEYRRGRLGKSHASLGDETIAVAVAQTAPVEEEILDAEVVTKEQKKSFMGMIQGITDTVLEIQGYIDGVASTLERIKNLFNFSVPWLSVLLIIILFVGSFVLYYVPIRYLILAFFINKFTKRFRKPKGYIDNNELVDFMSRLPSDPELMQYRELKVLLRAPTAQKKTRGSTNSK